MEQDFKERFPGKENGLISKWEIAKLDITTLARKECAKTNTDLKEILEDIDKCPEGNFRILF